MDAEFENLLHYLEETPLPTAEFLKMMRKKLNECRGLTPQQIEELLGHDNFMLLAQLTHATAPDYMEIFEPTSDEELDAAQQIIRYFRMSGWDHAKCDEHTRGMCEYLEKNYRIPPSRSRPLLEAATNVG